MLYCISFVTDEIKITYHVFIDIPSHLLRTKQDLDNVLEIPHLLTHSINRTL